MYVAYERLSNAPRSSSVKSRNSRAKWIVSRVPYGSRFVPLSFFKCLSTVERLETTCNNAEKYFRQTLPASTPPIAHQQKTRSEAASDASQFGIIPIRLHCA